MANKLINAEKLWNTVGLPLSTSETPLVTALDIVRSGVLTEHETAFLISAGAKHFSLPDSEQENYIRG